MQEQKLSEWAKQHGYTYRGAFNVYKRGNIPNAYKTASGVIRIKLPESSISKPAKDYTVVYDRVSSSENKSNLDTQAERVSQYCNAKGWIVNEVVKECASGLNDRRPKLLKLLKQSKATRIVVEHKDRLTRFGFGYIEVLFSGELIVINEAKDNTNDIMQDFVSLGTSFTARLYGKRRSKRATEKLIKELKNEQV